MRSRPGVVRHDAPAIVGPSAATVLLRQDIARVAAFSSNVLVTGPSGTGKELVARQIHAASSRSQQHFIPVDCASIAGELMASQLFGHVAGAFTGATYDAIGCFRAAHLGTIFLDEIGELDFALQSRLLRVLQDHVVTPVGSPNGERVDVRVVAATNRNLAADVQAGRFREDLYYRLNVVHLRTVALKDRPEDIGALADEFLLQLECEGLPRRSLSAESRAVLLNFHWPGNVRQLRNVLEQAAIDSNLPVIEPELICRILSLSFSGGEDAFQVATLLEDVVELPLVNDLSQSGDATWQTLDDVEREHIARTLESTFYNCSAAARLLGVSRQALSRKMAHHGLERRLVAHPQS